MKRVVAHFSDAFFEASETFIYQYVSRHVRFKPVCIAKRFVNLDQFPFADSDIYVVGKEPGNRAGSYYEWFNRKWLHREPQLARRVRKVEFDIMHAHKGVNGCVVASLKRRRGFPLVTTFYGFDLSKKDVLENNKRGYRYLFREGDLFLVEGPHMRDRLAALGCPPQRTEIQRIAIPVRDIPFRPRQPKRAGEKAVLLFAGRFVEKKGLKYLLAALREVGRERSDFELRIIGDGPLRPDIESAVRTGGLENQVALLGFLPYRDYLEEMASADLFVQPSVTASDGDSEGGAPTVILEAQAHGMPVIATTHADIPNVVVPGGSALLCPERDAGSLAQNILSALNAQEEWAEMGSEGRRFVESYHDIELEVVALEKKYARLLDTG
jgi:colanic acid/amylovoran biosynthesis glycosyltransferase